MTSGFKFDKNAQRQLEKEVMAQYLTEMQRMLDGVFRTHGGKSVGDVKRALQRASKKDLGNALTDPELTQWAETISQGTKVKVRAA